MAQDKPVIIGSGLSGMIGSRFTQVYANDFTFMNLDLTTGVDITEAKQVETALSKYQNATVIHLAAFTDVSKAFDQNGDKNGSVYKVNVIGTQNIANAAKKFGHFLIHISTDFVFDGVNPPEGGYTETDTPKPIEWYGQTKLWAEQEVQKSGANHVIVRTAFPYRAKFAGKLDLIRNMLEKLKTNSLYPMFTDQIITPTFIDDLSAAFKTIIDKKPNGIFHAVGSSSLSPYEIAQKIASAFEIKADIKSGSFKDFMVKDSRLRQQYLKISNAKLKQELGVSMKTLDEALKILKDQGAGV